MYQHLSFFYNHAITRGLLKMLANPCFSKFMGWLLSSRCSVIFISGFAKKNHIDLNDYEEKKYTSFNDFFIRKVKPVKRPFDASKNVFISPCDGKLSAYEISEDLHVEIKGTDYTIPEILNQKPDPSFDGGTLIVLRLTPDDYHRYHFSDDGEIKSSYHIPGKFHTVNPIIHQYQKVFHENDREVTELSTTHFGTYLQVEVGAMFVGKIKNHALKKFSKGDEKGYFLFGGSTILLILKKNQVQFDTRYFEATKMQKETPVLFGEKIGEIDKNT